MITLDYKSPVEAFHVLQSQIPIIHRASDFHDPKFLIAIRKDHELVGAVCLHQVSMNDVNISLAGIGTRWACRKILKDIAFAVFTVIGAKRMTAVCSESNHRVRKLLEGCGFVLEGVKRGAYDGTNSSMIYGCLKEECKFYGDKIK